MPLMRRSRPKDRNFWLGVVNGILVNGGEAFLHSGLVLAPFLALLGAPSVLIGLVPTLRVGGSFLPQLLVANRLSHEPLKMPYYNLTSGLRIGSLALLTAAAFFIGPERPGLTIAVLLVTVTVNAVAGGVAGVPFADVTAKVVPHGQLGTFWALRNSVGGVVALGAGWALRAILASDMPFPTNFGLVFLVGTLLCGAAYLVFSLVREPPGEAGVKRPLLRMFREIPGLLRQDVNLRRFLRVRLLGLAALLAEPFYGVYALERLAAPDSAMGLYVMVATVASIVGNFAVRRPANKGFNVTVLQVGFALGLLTPVLALLAGSWQLFSLVFVLSSVGNAAVGIAAWNLLYAIAPPGDRPLYIGLSNTVLALPSVAPVVAGALLSVVGYRALFGVALGLSLLTLAFSFRFAALRAADQAALRAEIGADEQPPTEEHAQAAGAALASD